MKKLLSNNLIPIFLLYLSWRVSLIFFLVIGLLFVPLGHTDRFLGGGPINFYTMPALFSWANFDGEHYLSIAMFGYKSLEQAFFPLFPMVISVISRSFSFDLYSLLVASTITGILISNLSFLFAIFLLFKLIKLDYSSKIAYWTIAVLLLFPTSFYFGALYNESLYLLLSVVAIYAARTNRWWMASASAIFASATRVFGLLLFPVLIIEAWQQKSLKKNIIPILLSPMGFIFYLIYQWFTVGNPLAFYNLQELVGEQHRVGITLLPQIYYRYLKIIFSMDISNPIYQTIVLELLTGILFFTLPFYGFLKGIRLSYLIYALIGFVLPTIQGSFSSLPRYVIVLFPSFMALAIYIQSKQIYIKVIVVLVMAVLLAVESILFLRGYWVA